ncbi:hypothetical protein MESS2_1080049 [Mesorhizobium metallidurans STM 2683]|uniref:Uncharacterized protein n=1 Tax=Mesorhizobium metallidurans STM 2683 TaxID=1297569 RepID=M5EGP3_9HYPH|nr:hypothetical protein MESS2_1080049 [Mesorhizobium metallidurans STM 2683]
MKNLPENEGADGEDQNEQDGRREEAARKEAESHRQEHRSAKERPIFGERDKARIGAVVLGIVHLRAQFDRTGRRVISHRNNPFEDIFQAHSEKPGRGQWRYCRIAGDNCLKGKLKLPAKDLPRRPGVSTGELRKQPEQADDDQIEGDDIVQQPRHDQDQHAGDQGNQRGKRERGDGHVGSFRSTSAKRAD